ncbi:MAG: diacylglycerol kinase family protein [Bryobacterales bacterium]|nr:diacylglycerol kinase family protein [Bryobacterales bacterium]
MSISSRVSLIVNAESGSLDMDEVLPLIYEAFPGSPPLTRFVSAAESAAELAAQEVAEGVDLVIAVGGDGTVSQVAGALAHTPAALGVIPVGTANAFARAMGIPLDVADAAAVFRNGSRRMIDLGRCILGDGQAAPVLLLAAIGYEAKIVRNASRERKEVLGAFAYLYTGLELLTGLQPFSVTLATGDRAFVTAASAITVANAAPATSPLAQGLGAVIPNDGLLEVTIFSPASPTNAFARMVELFGAAALDLRIWRDDIIAFRTATLSLRTDPPQPLAIDGELRESAAPEFGIEAACLQVAVP